MGGTPEKPVSLAVAQQGTGIQKTDRIIVDVVDWKKSKVVVINVVLIVAATFVQLFDLLTGANVLQPIVGLFVKDPEGATKVITVLTQVYSIIALYLRTKNYAPISFK